MENQVSATFALTAEKQLINGQFEEAISICKDGLLQYPNYPSAMCILAKAYYFSGDFESAKSIISDAFKHFPTNIAIKKIKQGILELNLEMENLQVEINEKIDVEMNFEENFSEEIDDKDDKMNEETFETANSRDFDNLEDENSFENEKNEIEENIDDTNSAEFNLETEEFSEKMDENIDEEFVETEVDDSENEENIFEEENLESLTVAGSDDISSEHFVSEIEKITQALKEIEKNNMDDFEMNDFLENDNKIENDDEKIDNLEEKNCFENEKLEIEELENEIFLEKNEENQAENEIPEESIEFEEENVSENDEINEFIEVENLTVAENLANFTSDLYRIDLEFPRIIVEKTIEKYLINHLEVAIDYSNINFFFNENISFEANSDSNKNLTVLEDCDNLENDSEKIVDEKAQDFLNIAKGLENAKIAPISENISNENEKFEAPIVASETMAKIFIKQKSFDKAIEVYEILKIEKPEKIDFFNEQIESLQAEISENISK